MPFESPRGRSQIAETRSVPAPVGGLNYRDSAAAMPATDALRMLNFQPLPYAVALRKGWAIWGGEYPAPIFTIINHIIERSSSGQHVLVFSDGNLYVQTFPNDPVPTPLSTSVGGRYEHASLRNDAGTLFTYMVSVGLDPIVYQGTAGPPPTSTLTVVHQSMVNPPVAPLDIYGVDPKKFLNVALHKNRLWFVETASTSAWYLADGAVGGEAKKYPLGGVFSKGGTLQAIATWTVDAGSGMDDYMVFISSEGQIAIYGGEVADTSWGLQGVYDIGSPIGLRCWIKYGGDVLLITTDGVVPLSKALQSTRVNSTIALTDKIQQLISLLISTNRDAEGWQLLLFPDENQVWLITPPLERVGGQPIPRIFSMNTITGAWCEFDNMDILDVTLWNDKPLFGTTDGTVALAWIGTFDGSNYTTGEGGDYINAEVLTAYNYFNETARNKRWVLARPIFQSGVVPSVNIGLSVDFELLETAGSVDIPPTPAALALWGVAIWGVDLWGNEPARYRRWISTTALGYCAALNMRVRCGTPLLFTATDFVFEMGGVI